MLALHFQNRFVEAGCDEAGRGCLAGPVFAAAVILPRHFYLPELNDSKQLNEKQRLYCRDYILKNAMAYSVANISVREIEKINILNASIAAMHKALLNLKVKPQFIIVDGNRFKPYLKVPFQTIVKGDSKFASIAAASVLAKTFRDDYMLKIHEANLEYFWNRNKGYPTIQHREAIAKYGVTKHHRKTFQLLKPDMQLKVD